MEFISFKKYLEEEHSYDVALTGINSKSLTNQKEIDLVNSALARVSSQTYITPYMALGVISKILACVNIVLPQTLFLKDEETLFIEVYQFGDVADEDNSYYLIFDYGVREDGLYDVDVELVTAESIEEN